MCRAVSSLLARKHVLVIQLILLLLLFHSPSFTSITRANEDHLKIVNHIRTFLCSLDFQVVISNEFTHCLNVALYFNCFRGFEIMLM